MPLRIPDEPKILTKVYDSFRGVDFTNDPTNIWSKRSPDAVNMLPDEAGRPFKRTGYEDVITDEVFKTLYSPDYDGDFSINRCYYFELGGISYIMIFTNIGLFRYADANGMTPNLQFLSDDPDIIESTERAYFFEGNGTSAFYVYGNYRVWRFTFENGFEELLPEIPKSVNYAEEIEGFTHDTGITIPTVRIGVSADGSGTDYEGVNLLGGYISEDFGDASGITVAHLILPIPEESADKVLVFISLNDQFDTLLTVVDSTGTPSPTQCVLSTIDGQSTITFDSAKTSPVDGQDAVKVIYPRVETIITNHDEATRTSETATA